MNYSCPHRKKRLLKIKEDQKKEAEGIVETETQDVAPAATITPEDNQEIIDLKDGEAVAALIKKALEV